MIIICYTEKVYYMYIYSAHVCHSVVNTPGAKPLLPLLYIARCHCGAHALQGIISCRVPNCYTWVKRDKCGQNALSIKAYTPSRDRTHDPLDYESRAQTNTLQSSHISIALLLYTKFTKTYTSTFHFIKNLVCLYV